MKVRDFFHAQPTEFTITHRTCHMVTRTIVHLNNQRHTLRARLDIIVRVRRFTVRRGQRTDFKLILHTGQIARCVRMPQLSTMVAELVAATRSLTLQLRTARTPRRDHRVAAIRRGAPPDVGDADECATQRKFLVLGEQVVVVENHLHVAGVTHLRALRTRHHDTTLAQRDHEVLFQTVDAVAVFTVY